MRRVSLESSVIAAAGYDPGTAVLEIEFTTGEAYRYFAVPPSVYRGLRNAASAGRFFSERIRDVYPSQHIGW